MFAFEHFQSLQPVSGLQIATDIGPGLAKASLAMLVNGTEMDLSTTLTTACTINFDVRWKSVLPAEYCLNDSAQQTPLRCWPRGDSGEHRQERVVSEEFVFWLSPPSGMERVAEAKIEVLRVGSDDRRRERRARHVWDVL